MDGFGIESLEPVPRPATLVAQRVSDLRRLGLESPRLASGCAGDETGWRVGGLGHCSMILEQATRWAVRFPRQVRKVLEKALEVRDRCDHGAITTLGARITAGRLQAGPSS